MTPPTKSDEDYADHIANNRFGGPGGQVLSYPASVLRTVLREEILCAIRNERSGNAYQLGWSRGCEHGRAEERRRIWEACLADMREDGAKSSAQYYVTLEKLNELCGGGKL